MSQNKTSDKINTPEPPQKKYPLEQSASEKNQRKKLGIALVGLGKYCTTQVMPALEQSEYYQIAAIVTGSIDKEEEYARKYNLSRENIYNYENFDNIKTNKNVDIVYITLPNSMHEEYTIRAATAQKHVICEKPMGVSKEECKKMIETCNAFNRLLFLGYRLHYEPFNREAMKFGQEEEMGEVKSIEASFGFEIGTNQWRLNKEMAGGGCLMDTGIYCLQASCYVLNKEPIAIQNAIMHKDNDKKFKQVESDIKWEMIFDNNIIAYCHASYVKETDRLYIKAEKGWMELKPAFYYKGVKGKTSEGRLDIASVNQQKAHLDGIAETILNNKTNRVPGIMGLRDLRIIEAIYKCAETKKTIPLSSLSEINK